MLPPRLLEAGDEQAEGMQVVFEGRDGAMKVSAVDTVTLGWATADQLAGEICYRFCGRCARRLSEN